MAKTVRGKLDFDPELATVDSSNLIKRIKFVYLSTDIDSGEISRDLITKSNNYKAYSDTIGDTEVFEFEIHFEEKGAQKLTLYLEDIIVVKNDSAPMKMSIKTYEYSGQKEVFVEDLNLIFRFSLVLFGN